MKTDDITELEPPFYVIDLATVRGRIDAIQAGFETQFDDVIVGYSYKTNYVPEMLRAIHEQGARAEVVSILEYRLARRIGMPADRIIFNGPNKSADDIGEAIEGGAIINLDSLDEVEAALAWSEESGQTARFGLRVNLNHPEYDDHRDRSRFGLTEADIEAAVDRVAGADAEIVGLHAHLSTKARDLEVFEAVADQLGRAAQLVGVDGLDYIDTGGGLGYAPPEMGDFGFPSFADYAERISETLADYGLADKTLIVEPGIAACGDAVSFYTPVEVTKAIGGRHVAFVDGSIHNVKPTRHSHNLPTEVFDADWQPKEGDEVDWDVVGYTCMDDDYIGIDQPLPDLEPGDILHIDNVGAYTIVFNPPFIRTRPPIYVYEEGEYRTARRDESVEDFFAEYTLPKTT